MSPAGDVWIDYDYSIVRLVPQVHLEQFVNIGVILHARTEGALLARIEPDWNLAKAMGGDPLATSSRAGSCDPRRRTSPVAARLR